MTTLLQVLVNLSYIILFASLLAQIVLRSDTRIACNLSAAVALMGGYFLYDPEAHTVPDHGRHRRPSIYVVGLMGGFVG